MKAFYLIFLIYLSILFTAVSAKRLSAENCKVCIDVVEGIEKTLTESDKKDLPAIEDKIASYCKQKKISSEQKKICYHIDPIKRELSRPLSFGMPAEDICIRKLNKNNPEFCAVKYSTEKSTASEQKMDPSKMRISQLKSYLAEHGAKCAGCYEKSDYVRKVKEVMEAEL